MTESEAFDVATASMMDAVRTLTVYFPKGNQVSFDPYNITKGAVYWFFVSPLSSNNSTRLASHTKVIQWVIPCELDVKFKTEAESAEKMIAVRGEITSLLHKPRVLKNINVNKVTVALEGKPFQDTPAEAQPNFIIQKMNVTIEQIVRN